MRMARPSANALPHTASRFFKIDQAWHNQGPGWPLMGCSCIAVALLHCRSKYEVWLDGLQRFNKHLGQALWQQWNQCKYLALQIYTKQCTSNSMFCSQEHSRTQEALSWGALENLKGPLLCVGKLKRCTAKLWMRQLMALWTMASHAQNVATWSSSLMKAQSQHP